MGFNGFFVRRDLLASAARGGVHVEVTDPEVRRSIVPALLYQRTTHIKFYSVCVWAYPGFMSGCRASIETLQAEKSG